MCLMKVPMLSDATTAMQNTYVPISGLARTRGVTLSCTVAWAKAGVRAHVVWAERMRRAGACEGQRG